MISISSLFFDELLSMKKNFFRRWKRNIGEEIDKIIESILSKKLKRKNIEEMFLFRCQFDPISFHSIFGYRFGQNSIGTDVY